MNFDPLNHSFKIRESIDILIPKVGVHLRVCGFIPSHSLALSECECDSQVASLACIFPCPCLDHEPKAKVVTMET